MPRIANVLVRRNAVKVVKVVRASQTVAKWQNVPMTVNVHVPRRRHAAASN